MRYARFTRCNVNFANESIQLFCWINNYYAFKFFFIDQHIWCQIISNHNLVDCNFFHSSIWKIGLFAKTITHVLSLKSMENSIHANVVECAWDAWTDHNFRLNLIEFRLFRKEWGTMERKRCGYFVNCLSKVTLRNRMLARLFLLCFSYYLTSIACCFLCSTNRRTFPRSY